MVLGRQREEDHRKLAACQPQPKYEHHIHGETPLIMTEAESDKRHPVMPSSGLTCLCRHMHPLTNICIKQKYIHYTYIHTQKQFLKQANKQTTHQNTKKIFIILKIEAQKVNSQRVGI